MVNGNPLENLKVLYPTGIDEIRDGKMVHTGGVEWTIKDGIPYHAPTLMARVKGDRRRREKVTRVPCPYRIQACAFRARQGRGGHLFARPFSSTTSAVTPGGSTCSVFKNSITESCSYFDSFSNACRAASASPACASVACRIVV